MPEARWGAASCVVRNKLVVAAGWVSRDSRTAPCLETTVYDADADAWTTAAPLPMPLRPSSAMVAHRGRALLLGSGGPPLLLTDAMDAWEPAPDLLAGAPTRRFWMMAAGADL